MREKIVKLNFQKFISPITWLFRIICGGVFIFSGIVKGIDPWGTIYKFQDYLSAMGLHFEDTLIVAGAAILSGFEFLLGVFLFFGCFRKSTPILTVLFMSVMLPLTLWIAISDPVKDCGCFGDALIISNWATFGKNVILCIMLVWLLIFNNKVHWGITPALQWLAFVASAFLILFIEFIGYYSQPVIDFRHYKIGTSLFAEGESEEDDNEESMVFIYEKDGVSKEFAVDEIPDEDDGWVFVERKEIASLKRPDDRKPESNNLTIWSPENEEEDFTQEFAESADDLLIITFPSLNEVSIASSWKINSLYTWATRKGISVIGLAAGTQKDIAEWIDLSMAEYPVYCAEDTVIKEIVRGNPGLVYIKNGIIQWKSSLQGIEIDDFLSEDTDSNIKYLGKNDNSLFRNSIILYLIIIAFLIMLSFTPSLRYIFLNKKAERHEPSKDIKTRDTE